MAHRCVRCAAIVCPLLEQQPTNTSVCL